MKFRPQVQLRFRDEGQYVSVKQSAADLGISLNEFLLRKLENGVVALGTPEAHPQLRGRPDREREPLRKTAAPPVRDEAETVPAPVMGPEVARNPTLPSDCHSPSLPKKSNKLTPAQFLELKPSERMKATREGLYP
jgi:hypothetical protein